MGLFSRLSLCDISYFYLMRLAFMFVLCTSQHGRCFPGGRCGLYNAFSQRALRRCRGGVSLTALPFLGRVTGMGRLDERSVLDIAHRYLSVPLHSKCSVCLLWAGVYLSLAKRILSTAGDDGWRAYACDERWNAEQGRMLLSYAPHFAATAHLACGVSLRWRAPLPSRTSIFFFCRQRRPPFAHGYPQLVAMLLPAGVRLRLPAAAVALLATFALRQGCTWTAIPDGPGAGKRTSGADIGGLGRACLNRSAGALFYLRQLLLWRKRFLHEGGMEDAAPCLSTVFMNAARPGAGQRLDLLFPILCRMTVYLSSPSLLPFPLFCPLYKENA